MICWFKSLFAWRAVRNSGVWLYEKNGVTGCRKATRVNIGGYQPLDLAWLNAGAGKPIIIDYR